MSRNKHHRKPRSQGGKSTKYNCVLVDENRHYLWHKLFANMTGEEIMQDFNTCFIDPRFKIVYRLKEAKMSTLRQANGGVVIVGFIENEDHVDLIIEELILAQQRGRKVQILIEPAPIVPLTTPN